MTASRHRSSRLARAVLALAVLGAVTAACGDSGGDDAAATSTTGRADGTIEVTATDYAFGGLPAEVAAGARLELRNESATEVHEIVAVRLPEAETRSAAELVALPPEELGGLFGGPPALVLVAPPGDEGFVAAGDGTLAEPGRYLVACFIPTGADPAAYLDALEANPGQPPSVPGGPPHFTGGMHAEVSVR